MKGSLFLTFLESTVKQCLGRTQIVAGWKIHFWWYLPEKKRNFHGYVSLSEGSIYY